MNLFSLLFSSHQPDPVGTEDVLTTVRTKDLETALKAMVLLLEMKNRANFDVDTDAGIRRERYMLDGGTWL